MPFFCSVFEKLLQSMKSIHVTLQIVPINTSVPRQADETASEPVTNMTNRWRAGCFYPCFSYVTNLSQPGFFLILSDSC
jgi:hypothetical protein